MARPKMLGPCVAIDKKTGEECGKNGKSTFHGKVYCGSHWNTARERYRKQAFKKLLLQVDSVLEKFPATKPYFDTDLIQKSKNLYEDLQEEIREEIKKDPPRKVVKKSKDLAVQADLVKKMEAQILALSKQIKNLKSPG